MYIYIYICVCVCVCVFVCECVCVCVCVCVSVCVLHFQIFGSEFSDVSVTSDISLMVGQKSLLTACRPC